MSKQIKRYFLSAVIVCVCSFLNDASSQQSEINSKGTTSKPPEFNDGGTSINTIKATYDCEIIEFENWEEDDAEDSTLTVCLINSKNVPIDDFDERFTLLKALAKKIKNALRHPEKYKSYYIIFVKREIHFGITSSSHTSGANIPGKDL